MSAKDRRNIDPYWNDLGSESYEARIVGNILVLATIHQMSRMKPCPGLSRWIYDIMEPVYGRYHDRELRDYFRGRMEKLKDTGEIVTIAALLDNRETITNDHANYRVAMQEFLDLRREYSSLEVKLENPDTFGKETGREIAAIVAGLLSGLIILTFCFLFFLNKGLF